MGLNRLLYSRLQNLPSILVLHVSRALELRIGLWVKLWAELRAELQGGDPLGPPCALHTPSTAWPVHWVDRGAAKPLVELLQSFVRSFVQSFCRALAELDAELCRALVELNVLKFVTWILPQLTARTFFPTNQKLAWRGLNSRTRKYRPLVPRVNKYFKKIYFGAVHEVGQTSTPKLTMYINNKPCKI